LCSAPLSTVLVPARKIAIAVACRLGMQEPFRIVP
jgi:hypothetical protein